VGVAAHFFKDWKPTLYDKGYGSTTRQQSSVKVNKWQKERAMFGANNIQELLNQRPTDESSFKSGLLPNKHIQSTVYSPP
jgi:hypothetical protein